MNIRTASRIDLDHLTSMEGGPHVSIYLSAPVAIADAPQDRIRIKNLARSAHQTLVENWMTDVDGREFLKPLQALAYDGDLQTPHRHGLAIFLCEGFSETYRVDANVEEQLAVGRRFRVRPTAASKFMQQRRISEENKVPSSTGRAVCRIARKRICKTISGKSIKLSARTCMTAVTRR